MKVLVQTLTYGVQWERSQSTRVLVLVFQSSGVKMS